MRYRMGDDSVTVRGKGHPEYSGKSVTTHGERIRQEKGPEPGRFDVGSHEHPERIEGKSTARDVTSVNPEGEEPILPAKMPNLR
jgi:hypothetical protein